MKEKTMDIFFKDLHSQLISEGTVVIPQEKIPFSPEEWQTLDTIVDNEEYESVVQGDTYEATSVKVFRIKRAGEDNNRNQHVMDILNSSPFKSKIAKIMNARDYILDRCQYNVYQQGDFVATHKDTDSCFKHHFACMIYLSSKFEGGALCVYNPNRDLPYLYQPKPNSLILTRCDFPHEVKHVTQGLRKTIVCFLSIPGFNLADL